MTQVSADRLSGALAQQLIQNRYLDGFRNIGTIKISGVIDHILEYYYSWADDGREEKLAGCRDFMVKVCTAMSIPVVEAAYALYALRDGLQDSVASEGREKVAKFFDLLVVQLMRGY